MTADTSSGGSRPRVTLATAGDGWADFLQRLSATALEREAFVARNFRIEEGPAPERVASYATRGGAADHGDLGRWSTAHENYLTERVFCPPGIEGLPKKIEAAPRICPETFLHPGDASAYAQCDDGVRLVRVEQARFVAAYAGTTVAELMGLARRSVESGEAAARHELALLLEEWAHQVEIRPTFAGIFEDVEGLFGPTPGEDRPEWADELRDRLGLASLDPGDFGAPIDVLVFLYPVAHLPVVKDRIGKAIVPPTVLDGRFSPAFFPPPVRSSTGHTLHLACDPESACREVVHPTIGYRADDLFRAGTIARPVDWDRLREARGLHLLLVRDRSGRADYAEETDGDLLR